MKNLVRYHRVSIEKQENPTREQQINACRKLADENHFIVLVYKVDRLFRGEK